MLSTQNISERPIIWTFWYALGNFSTWYTIMRLKSIQFANSHYWAIFVLITLIFGTEIIFVNPKRKEIKKKSKKNGPALYHVLKYIFVTLVGGLTWLGFLFSGIVAIYFGVVPGI